MKEPDSKTKILNAATQLFARQGYDGTSLQAIANIVGMRKPSLLHHYPSKEALREAVMDKLVVHWKTRMPELLMAANRGADRFQALFTEGTEFFRADPNRALLIMREVLDRPDEIRARVEATISPWFKLLVQTIKEGQRAEFLRREVDPSAYVTECIILIIGTISTADLFWPISQNKDKRDHLDRQIKEIIRMARVSLFASNSNPNLTGEPLE